jgi:hypothetical protein
MKEWKSIMKNYWSWPIVFNTKQQIFLNYYFKFGLQPYLRVTTTNMKRKNPIVTYGNNFGLWRTFWNRGYKQYVNTTE